MSHLPEPSVLIADDEDICLKLTEKMLEIMGIRVLCAQDGTEVVSLYEQYQDSIACVLLDIQMPRMNGIEAFRILRHMDNDVRVIIVSGYVNGENRAQIDPLYPLGYIKKPLSFAKLQDMISQVIEVRR